MLYMSLILLSEIGKYVGEEISVCGFVQSLRDQKHMQFLILRDYSASVQVVHEKKADSALAEIISSLTDESAVQIIGTVVLNSKVKLGGLEIVLKAVQCVDVADYPLPIGKNPAPETRLDWRFLDLRRNPTNTLIFRVQTAMERAMREFWDKYGFIEIHSPKLMGVPSESGAELFELDYFGKRKAYLAQSPQFFKQMAIAAGFRRVFEIGPVFRANPSYTSRHDAEFISLDVEFDCVKSHHDVMDFEQEWLRFTIVRVKQEFGDEIRKHFGVEIMVPELPFPRITLSDAIDILEKMGYVIEHRDDLDPEGERKLCQYIMNKYGHEFVFVIDYPVVARPFYHMRQPDKPWLTYSFDLLYKGLEVTTGAQREHRLAVLKEQAIEKGLSLEPLKYYLDFFRYGCPPHGGFGAGLTRLLMALLDRPNVREVTYLYRGPNRLNP